MESTATASLCSPFLPSLPFSNARKLAQPNRSSRSMVLASLRRGSSSNGNRDFERGRLVDENMIVLRKRIHEMKMVERNYEPPSHWMEWEKRLYVGYDSFICDVMGILQSQLMNTRPSLALGMMALVTLSVPISSAMILLHLIEISQGVLGGLHL